MRLILDIEGDDLYPGLTKVHCIVTKDLDTGEVRRFRAHGRGAESIQAGLRYIEKAEEVIGHNLLGYDLDALKKIYPDFNYTGRVFDTLVASALIYTNLMELDALHRAIPTNCYGKHSLKAWGHRLGVLKGTFGEDGEDKSVWAEWSQEMEDYCAQDVEVTHKLYTLLVSKKYSETALELEHQFKRVIVEQERHGWAFNVAAAEKLAGELQVTRLALTEELQAVFPPREEVMKKPSCYFFETETGERIEAETKGKLTPLLQEYTGLRKVDEYIQVGPPRIKLHPFNPGSRTQIAERLIERYQWKPKKYTEPSKNYPEGQVQIDESVLEGLPYPEAKLLNKYLLVGKILGQLAEGDNACLRLQKNGRIYGSVQTNGAVTGRCTHSKPNIAQTPAVTMVKGADGKKAPLLGLDGGFGWEFRSLYIPDPGKVSVGWDASGLELRCLAHFLFPYDEGRFGQLVTEGDPHTENQNAAGFYLRDSAKTFIYAYLYGAGDAKLGAIAVQDAIDAGKPRPKGSLASIGKALRARFEANFVALRLLKDDIKAVLKGRDYLVGLDGRRLHVRSDHAALNTLLQSAGALLMKKAAVLQHLDLRTVHGLSSPKDYAQVGSIHDELQFSALPDCAELIGRTGPEALRAAGRFFDFQCRLDGEFKIGRSWAETH